jgi:Protein of unknown function (DUF4054)
MEYQIQPHWRDDFLARFSEFRTVEPDQVAIALEDALTIVACQPFGSSFQRALFLVAAHFLASNPTTSANPEADANGLPAGLQGKPIKRLKFEDDFEVEFEEKDRLISNSSSRADGANADFNGTAYGRQYLQLKRANIIPVMVL